MQLMSLIGGRGHCLSIRIMLIIFAVLYVTPTIFCNLFGHGFINT